MGGSSSTMAVAAGSAAAFWSSYAIAASTDGSPSVLATTKATNPARSPTSRPPIKRLRMGSDSRLVAGEAEKVPTVVHELVDRLATDEREGTLLGADEENGEHQQQPGEDRPGQDRADQIGRAQCRERGETSGVAV